MASKKLSNEQLWQLAMVILPAIVFMNMDEALTANEQLQFLYSMMLALVGAFLGYLVFYLTKKKSFTVKLISTIVLYVGSIGVLLAVTSIVGNPS